MNTLNPNGLDIQKPKSFFEEGWFKTFIISIMTRIEIEIPTRSYRLRNNPTRTNKFIFRIARARIDISLI